MPKSLDSWKIWNNLIKKKRNIVIIISLIFILSILSGCIGSENNINSSNGGEDFAFTTLNGNEKHLSDYHGKIVILDLMGVNCPPCQIEMFELKEVSKNYNHNDVAIISVDVYTGYPYYETADTVKSLINAFRQQVDIELDWIFSVDSDGTIGQKYIINGSVPSLYIFDQEGKIYFRHAGATMYDKVLPSWPSSWPTDGPKLKPIIDELLE
jgi:thiol-disulfide isomerase/thioredoxin